MSVGAHPADIFDQSGGTMAHHIERGDQVACVVLTHGARVHDEVLCTEMFHSQHIPDARTLSNLMTERSDIKADEVRQACAILGIEEVFFFGAEDGVIMPERATALRVASLIRSWKPDVLLTHFPYENGGFWNSHASAGHIALMAREAASSVEPGDDHPPHHVACTFFWGAGAGQSPHSIWEVRRGIYNNVIIDITDVVEKKLAAQECLQSQGYHLGFARKAIETTDGHVGRLGGVAYGEAFISERSQTYRYLPVSDYALTRARQSDREQLAVISYKLDTFNGARSHTV
ncbi:MAG: PIG-L family deacetylase [Phycisphaeraceae bacterium]|nr:PIG-L family deacetylase [Phycisphaeraceae bacterium]